MADITMCQNNDCKKKDKCFRYMAKPSEIQSYGVFANCNKKSNYENFILNRISK
jgi:hypothetical protein